MEGLFLRLNKNAPASPAPWYESTTIPRFHVREVNLSSVRRFVREAGGEHQPDPRDSAKCGERVAANAADRVGSQLARIGTQLEGSSFLDVVLGAVEGDRKTGPWLVYEDQVTRLVIAGDEGHRLSFGCRLIGMDDLT